MSKRKKILGMGLLVTFFLAGCGKKYTFSQNWQYDTQRNTASIQFQYQDNVIISAGEYVNTNSPNHIIYSLDLKTGKVNWKFDVGEKVILIDIKLLKDKIFLKDMQDKVVYLDAKTGKKLEKFTASNIPKTTLNHTFNGNKVVAVAGDEVNKKPAQIVCKDSNGKTLWSYSIKPLLKVKEPYAVNFSFLIDGSNLVIATYDGKIKNISVK